MRIWGGEKIFLCLGEKMVRELLDYNVGLILSERMREGRRKGWVEVFLVSLLWSS